MRPFFSPFAPFGRHPAPADVPLPPPPHSETVLTIRGRLPLQQRPVYRERSEAATNNSLYVDKSYLTLCTTSSNSSSNLSFQMNLFLWTHIHSKDAKIDRGFQFARLL
eukprot:Platyproteum_vivax@DN11127_c0_g1_i1.p1